ncbi:IclR family transcriptional regulator [Halobacillus shinanisalinarum]|uniref:IclR family transcriptional regulator n=1 Tax=Halobacillus shinanisalinarum TaxID=2932258 RepID=A0ABY4GW36_9BACI|nr:IclR family transcriptional regulator [Halobacillus shinanisalinarum]UOQ92333.1 IclR family transcriptional regulator [Halobacillus shinanisalinarum]
MTLKTLDNSLNVLKYFTNITPSWGVRELAKEMDMNHTIVYRILSTFENHGFLYQNDVTKKYHLGLRFLGYGQIVQKQFNISQAIHPIMERVANQTNESAFLTWLDGHDGVTVDIAESSQQIRFDVDIGSRSPLHAGASCKVMMAYLSKEEQEELIQKGLEELTPNTIVDAEELRADLNTIRDQGWVYSVGEFADQVFGLGVPLFDQGQKILASLTIAGPAYRLSESDVEGHVDILLKEAETIQTFLNQSGSQSYI